MSGGSDNAFISPTALGAFLGAGVGVLLAPVLDASLLARQEWFDDLRLAPEVALSPRGGTLGLSGVFLPSTCSCRAGHESYQSAKGAIDHRTDFHVRYVSTACGPQSRPKPDDFTPPNGVSTGVGL